MPVIAIVMLFPILWMFVVSLKTEDETYTTPLVWWPKNPTLQNYVTMWDALDFDRYFLNTAIVAGATTILSIVLAAPAAYAFARYRFTGARPLGTFLLSTQLFPRVILIVPYFMIMRELGLINSYTSLILIYISFALPFCVWMMRGYLATLPVEIDEASLIDGCGPFGTFLRIALPLCMPGIVATAIFSFLVGWNEFLFALMLTTEKEMSVVTVGLASLIGEYKTQWNEMMAAAIVGSLPAMILYAALERYLVQGLASGATKG
jgi:ABC-type glycerol-3-phosphate transport system permease component